MMYKDWEKILCKQFAKKKKKADTVSQSYEERKKKFLCDGHA